MGDPMSSQERVRTAIARRVPDRVPIQDGPWGSTIRRWESEGLPLGRPPADHFGYELVFVKADLGPRFPVKVLEENDEYIVETTYTGGVRRNHRDYSTTPEVIDCPIKRPEDWPAIRDRLLPDIKRVDWATSWSNYQAAREKGKYVVFYAICGYDLLQDYVRSELLLNFMALEPPLVKDMVDATSELVIQMGEMMWKEGFRFDGLWVNNDMGYRNTSLFSPQMRPPRPRAGVSSKRRSPRW